MYDEILVSVAKAAEEYAEHNENDYMIGDILYCGNCNTPKMSKIPATFVKDENGMVVPKGEAIVPCVCKCRRERDIAEEKQKKKLERVARLRANGIHDANIRSWTFENADQANPKLMDKAHRYCDKWSEMHDKNIGLLLFGNVGTGKTYVAACIANALIDRGIPVLMTKFSDILNDLSGFKEEDKNGYIKSLNNYELLIIDDLGVERQSDFALEQVYNVIDSRYKNGQPLIVTTNLSVEDLKNPKDIKYKRIYDRILEMTIPIKVDGLSRREQLHKDKLELAKELFAD